MLSKQNNTEKNLANIGLIAILSKQNNTMKNLAGTGLEYKKKTKSFCRQDLLHHLLTITSSSFVLFPPLILEKKNLYSPVFILCRAFVPRLGSSAWRFFLCQIFVFCPFSYSIWIYSANVVSLLVTSCPYPSHHILNFYVFH